MSVVHEIELDIDKVRVRADQPVHVRCGDKGSQTVKCYLMKNGEPYTVPSGTTAKLEILKRDGTWTVTNASASGTIVSGVVPPAAMTAPGECKRAYFRLVSSNGSMEDTTEDFYLYVFPNATQDAIESRPYSDQFEELLEASDEVLAAAMADIATIPIRAALGGGEIEMPLVQGQLASRKLSDPISGTVLWKQNSEVSVCTDYYYPLSPNTDSKAGKPILLRTGDTITVSSGFQAYLYKVEPAYSNGELFYRTLQSPPWINETTYTIEDAGLYFLARVRRYPTQSSLTPEQALGAVKIRIAKSIADELEDVSERFSADESAISDNKLYSDRIVENTDGFETFAVGGGEWTPRLLKQGIISTTTDSESGKTIIRAQNSVVNVCMPLPGTNVASVKDDIANPVYANKGDVVDVAEGFAAYMYRVRPFLKNGVVLYELLASSPWIEQTTYTIPVSGLWFIARIKTYPSQVNITPEEAYGKVVLSSASPIGARLDAAEREEPSVKSRTLSRNPYRTHFQSFEKVVSTTHAHCENDSQLRDLAAKYDHVAISNYHPSVPWYPLQKFFSSVPEGFLCSPNGEQAHFNGSATGVHVCSVGSFLARETDKYGGTIYDCIADTMRELQHPLGGGVTINHPTYSGLSASDICSILDSSDGVFAIEIYNSNSEAVSGNGYSIAQWDAVLATGRQVYGVCAPDHEVQLRPTENRIGFGYNHVLVRNASEEEILLAYATGRFYGSEYNDSLAFTDIFMSNTGTLTVVLTEGATVKFITASGESSQTASEDNDYTLTFTPTQADVYVRVEATNGTNTLYSNAMMIG